VRRRAVYGHFYPLWGGAVVDGGQEVARFQEPNRLGGAPRNLRREDREDRGRQVRSRAKLCRVTKLGQNTTVYVSRRL